MRSSGSRRKWFAALGVVAGILIAVIAANFVRSEKKVQFAIEASYGIDDPQFARVMGSLLGPSLIPGSQVTELVNGDAIFPEMLAAIRGAERTLTFESFIYWSGRIGTEFADALSERARSGVRVGTQWAQMFHSSPDEGSENIRLMYMLSIAAARRTLLLEQSYFVPGDLIIEMLASAARRGVRVEVIVPGEHTDTPRVRIVGRSRWRPLLDAGVRIFEYPPTHLHAKVMVADGLWSSVGSTNFDNRAFRLNDEANLNVLDAGFAAEMEATLAADRLLSREITLGEWETSRTWLERVRAAFWGLFRQQM